MGTVNDRNIMDLTEAEEIKKRWQEYTEELCRKRSSCPRKLWWCDYSPGATYPGIWSQVGLRSIKMNKASGGDGIPAELFQILKDDAVKVLHSICLQIWKTQQWPQDWKRSVFIPIPKKGSAKECSNYCAFALISYASKVMLKIFQARLQEYVNHELQMFKLDLEKAEEPKTNCQHLLDHHKSKRIPEKYLLLLHWLS